MDWSEYPDAEVIPGKVSGTPLFKGTRLPVYVVVENVDAFMEIEGQSLDEAILSTLECFPGTPGGAKGIRAVMEYRAVHEPMLQP